MIFSNLKQHSQYRDEVLKEIESAFQYKDENSFAIDFYQLVKESNLENCHLLLNDEHKLLAHIGVRPVTLHYNDVEVEVLLLGGIVTKKEYQGKGHFKTLYEHIYTLYKDKYAMIILWSDNSSFYEKLGFKQFGLTAVLGETPVTSEELESRGFQEENLSKYNDEDIKFLNTLYNESYCNTISIKRSINDWKDIKKITSMKFFRSNNKKDYLFFEKGQDLKGIIHETSFSKNKSTLDKLKPLQLLNPFLLDQDSFYIHLAWGKIINLSLFSKFINTISQGEIQISSGELSINANSFKVEEDELLPILFGPSKAQEIGQLIPPIYISGSDSI